MNRRRADRFRVELILMALLCACAAVSGSAETRWTLVRSASVTVIGDQSASTLRDVAQELEQFRAVLGRLSATRRPAPTAPTMVYVFGTRKTFESFVPLVNGKPASVGGYFQRNVDTNTIALSTEGFAEDAPIVLHEYSHLLVDTAVGSIPIWLNEGLAEYFSTFRLNSGGKSASIGLANARHVQLLSERFIPLSELLAVNRNSALYNESARRSIFYAESWALTHYLMTELPSGQALINQYAAAIAAGAPSDDAFATTFGQAPAAFESRLREYVRRMTFKAWLYTFDARLRASAPAPARVLSRGEADAWLGDLQLRIRRTSEAAKRIEGAVAAEPDTAAAQLALARLRLSQGRSSDAWPALERATRLAPDDFSIQYGAAAASLQYIENAGDGSVDVEQRAHDALTRAAALAPDSPDTFGWLAYADLRRQAWNDAATAISRAIELAPGRAEFRLRQADIMILRGAPAAARPMLQELARSVDRTSAERARRRLDALDAAGVPGTTAAAADPASAPPPAADRPPSRVRLNLRRVLDGEQRAFGRLTAVECTSGRVQFHVDVGGRDLVVAATQFADVNLARYTEGKDTTLGCGARVPPDPVYVTWRADKPYDWPDAIAGVAVALEFLPLDFVP